MAIPSPKNIWVAASDGDLDRVTELIEHHNLSPNVPDDSTYTPMHAAASYGHLHVLEYLISRGGDVNIADEDGDTPLYTTENTETARFLIQHGAIIDRRNNEGISPIEHLREEFPHISLYLESLLPPSAEVKPVSAPVTASNSSASPSQHSQNAVSEDLTDTLMQRVQVIFQHAEDQGGDIEEQLQQAVAATVLEGVTRGYELQQEASSQETERPSEKRTRIE